MSLGEVQGRIAAIQSSIAGIEALGAGRFTTGATGATATDSANGTSFATALATALDQRTASTAAGATGAFDVAGALTTRSLATRSFSATGAADSWVSPVAGRVTSGFGPRWGTQHEGMDIAAATGTPVRAASDGVVRRADWYGGYGNAVIIDHGDGVSTLYGHNSALTVQPGQTVRAGDVIAKAGSTGDSTGPHVHFEVRRNDEQIDPRPWLRARGVNV